MSAGVAALFASQLLASGGGGAPGGGGGSLPSISTGGGDLLSARSSAETGPVVTDAAFGDFVVGEGASAGGGLPGLPLAVWLVLGAGLVLALVVRRRA